MTDAPTQLHVAKLEPDAGVVKALAFWLAEAKTGQLRGVILLGTRTDGTRIRTSLGKMGDADAVYLAHLVIADAVHDALDRESESKLPDPKPEDDE